MDERPLRGNLRTTCGLAAALLFATTLGGCAMSGEAGRDPDEPAAIVGNAARPDQQVTVTNLASLGTAAESSPVLSIIVIGANVGLRDELDWLVRVAPA